MILGSQTFYGDVKSFTTLAPTMTVDLGIVMKRADGTSYKLYWSISNLSKKGLCANPEDLGDYYAWGELEPKDSYTWSNYRFGAPESFTKYNNTDKTLVLDVKDDAVRHSMSGKWRIPTSGEWEELLKQCEWKWTTQKNVKGMLVTAKNGNSIFLPIAGYKDGTSTYNQGGYGHYWSSTLKSAGSDHAKSVIFYTGTFESSNYYRYDGLSIRPVTE